MSNDGNQFFYHFVITHTIKIASPITPTSNAQGLMVEKYSKTSESFSGVSIADTPLGYVKPKKSLI